MNVLLPTPSSSKGIVTLHVVSQPSWFPTCVYWTGASAAIALPSWGRKLLIWWVVSRLHFAWLFNITKCKLYNSNFKANFGITTHSLGRLYPQYQGEETNPFFRFFGDTTILRWTGDVMKSLDSSTLKLLFLFMRTLFLFRAWSFNPFVSFPSVKYIF